MRTFFTFRLGPFLFYVPVTGPQMLLLMCAFAVALGLFFWHEMLFEQAHPHHYHTISTASY